MVDKIYHILGNDLPKITVLGPTYKAGTDDIRSSPAIKIIEILLDKGANIRAFDPIGMDNAKKELIFFLRFST